MSTGKSCSWLIALGIGFSGTSSQTPSKQGHLRAATSAGFGRRRHAGPRRCGFRSRPSCAVRSAARLIANRSLAKPKAARDAKSIGRFTRHSGRAAHANRRGRQMWRINGRLARKPKCIRAPQPQPSGYRYPRHRRDRQNPTNCPWDQGAKTSASAAGGIGRVFQKNFVAGLG